MRAGSTFSIWFHRSSPNQTVAPAVNITIHLLSRLKEQRFLSWLLANSWSPFIRQNNPIFQGKVREIRCSSMGGWWWWLWSCVRNFVWPCQNKVKLKRGVVDDNSGIRNLPRKTAVVSGRPQPLFQLYQSVWPLCARKPPWYQSQLSLLIVSKQVKTVSSR